jgi:hypothetical protein
MLKREYFCLRYYLCYKSGASANGYYRLAYLAEIADFKSACFGQKE